MPLTKRQSEILNFLRGYLTDHDYAPTLEEIADHFNLASLNGVYKHLNALEERGFIRRLANQARSIQVLDGGGRQSRASLPLLGTVAAGQPIEAVPDAEEISVPDSFLTKGENYVLRVSGDSMIDEHIQDGDLIVVEKAEAVSNGQMVVALVDEENVTLKKYYREDGIIRLQPANPELQPIYVTEDRLRVQGVVIGVMRRY